MLHFIRQYKDIIQRRLTIFTSFCFKFIGYMHTITNNNSNITAFNKVIPKIKWCRFFCLTVY